jgi:Mrp family chromosome partitioning ATPase
MDTVLLELKDMVDIVILDAPPAIVADPVILASKVDGVLLVIEPGKTKIGPAQVMMEHMNRAGARVVGAVLNPISRRKAHYYTKYQYYTSAYYGDQSNDHHFSDNGSNKELSKKKSRKSRKPKQESN